MTTRVAVCGVAGMGLYHVFAVPRVEGAELTAVCDVDEAVLAKHAERAQTFTSLEALLAADVADAVVIATPNAFHPAQVRTALEAGLHVYCEKPLANTVGGCREIAALARERGRVVQVGFQHRYQHSYAGAHDIVASGGIGETHRAALTATDWLRTQAYFEQRPWRKSWAAAGGGVLMMQAIHQLDAFLWTAGMPSTVLAKAWRARHDAEVEDDITAILEFPGAARGQITASTTDGVGANRIEVHGDTGSVVADGDSLRRAMVPEGVAGLIAGSEETMPKLEVSWEDVPADGAPVSFDECGLACLTDFVRAIGTGSAPRNDPRQATMAVEVANACYLSGVTGEEVSLPLDAERYEKVYAQLCSGEVTI